MKVTFWHFGLPGALLSHTSAAVRLSNVVDTAAVAGRQQRKAGIGD